MVQIAYNKRVDSITSLMFPSTEPVKKLNLLPFELTLMQTRHEDSISSSLLVRVQSRDSAAWQRLVHLYTPLIYHWSRRSGLNEPDSADVVQEVFTAIHRQIDSFERDQQNGTFRGWMRTITRNKVSDVLRKKQRNPEAEGGTDALNRLHLTEAPSEKDDDEADESTLTHQCLALIRDEFTENTWKAFQGTALDGRPVEEVARELGMSLGAVYIARTRVFKRLREELQGLL